MRGLILKKKIVKFLIAISIILIFIGSAYASDELNTTLQSDTGESLELETFNDSINDENSAARDDEKQNDMLASSEISTDSNEPVLRDSATYTVTGLNLKNTTITGNNLKQYACDYYAGERCGYFTVKLTDITGNPLSNKTVHVGYNGITLNPITDENGNAKVQINMKNAGPYTFVAIFLGDGTYHASMKTFLINIVKKPITITAKAKTFKAKTKIKKYTVALKTSKCSSINGKTYLSKGKKVTLTIKGKTYIGKSDAKGKVTFKITKLTKKGKHTATIKFAGDATYKAKTAKIKITVK